jgi:hypothetical protein
MQDFLQKISRRAYTPVLTCPYPYQVRQVEIEAGDCEGRLPLLFWTLNFVLGNLNPDPARRLLVLK